jgi:iron complex outermembrane receptor protein
MRKGFAMARGKMLQRACVAVALGLSMQRAAAGQGPAGDLSKLSVEDLMNVEVTSASKREQKLSRVAAAVFVITKEDIRRSGALNIPDLLRMVPGLDVAQINGSTWAISVRGFNGQYSNKLLVLVDGRVVYTPTFAGVFWDAQDLPLETIERIEVIRGPGGTIWGANAVNGVISIFTKKAGETPGALVEAGAGTIAQGFGTVQYGGALNGSTQYRVYTKYFNDSHLLDFNGQSGADGWHLLSGGFRVDSVLTPKDQLTVEGTLHDGREGQYSLLQEGVTPQANLALHGEVDLDGGAIQAAWNHTYSDRADSTLQFSFSRNVNGIFEKESENGFAVDYKYHMAVGHRHDLVAGLGYTDSDDGIRGDFAVMFTPASRDLQVFNAFVQDEIALIPERVYLTAGTKLEHDDYNGFKVLPSVRVAWELNERHMVWGAISRAVRTPSRADTEATANINSFPGPGGMPVLLRYIGNPDFLNETLVAYEAGYRTTLTAKLSLDVAFYFNDYDHLQTTEPGAFFFEATPLPAHLVEPLTNENLLHGDTEGVEAAARWEVTKRWTLSPGYAAEQIRMHTYAASMDRGTPLSLEHNAPHNSAQLRSHVELSHALGWNSSVFYVDRLNYQGEFTASKIPSYTRLDTNLNWKIREGLSMSVVGQNLLQGHHVEFLGSLGSVQSSELKRSGYIQFIWTWR